MERVGNNNSAQPTPPDEQKHEYLFPPSTYTTSNEDTMHLFPIAIMYSRCPIVDTHLPG